MIFVAPRHGTYCRLLFGRKTDDSTRVVVVYVLIIFDFVEPIDLDTNGYDALGIRLDLSIFGLSKE